VRDTIAALVFDFDGVVVETEEPEFIAWRAVFADHGAVLELEEWAVVIGTTDALDPLELLASRATGAVDPDAVELAYRRRHRELVTATRPQPGVVDVLDAAAALGLGVGIASSSPVSWVEQHLDRLGLRDRFGVIVGFDTVGAAKPPPHSYRRAVELLGAEPHEAVAFEDSFHGVQAAKAAGLACVAVPTAMTRHLDFTAADLVLGSFAELPLPEILSRCRAGRATTPREQYRPAP
jgi:HAD superfamily hydrolase (TIGR01509 family)